MTRILLRSPQDPAVVLRPLESTRRIGTNLGNLLYINAVHRALSVPGTAVTAGAHKTVAPDQLTEWLKRANAKYDRFVIPLANSFRLSFSDKLDALTQVVEGLDMPVTVVGVGVQSPLEGVDNESGYVRMGRTGSPATGNAASLERHDERVRRFVKAALEKSESIGVRGAITKNYLVSIGVDADRIDVIGCPSLFTWGADLTIEKSPKPLKPDSKISMNVDHRVAGIGAIVEHNVALYRHLTSVAQDSTTARVIITGNDEFDLTKRDPRTPIHTAHPLYQQGRLLYFPSAWAWIEYMRDQQFVFGSRLHGNIAALLAGTPAHLLVHDARTLELAEYHGIPHSRITDYAEPPTAADLYERSDFTQFNEIHRSRFGTYLTFLRRNGLTTIFDEGQSSAAFDRSIRHARRSRPVHSSARQPGASRLAIARSILTRALNPVLGLRRSVRGRRKKR